MGRRIFVTGVSSLTSSSDLFLAYPPNSYHTHQVIKNSLGQVETYQIDGAHATYVGPGDLHDPDYNHKGVSASIIDYLQDQASPLTQSYTAADLTNAYVSYEIYVYPSSTTEAQYVDDQPLWYALAIAGVFLFTAAIFIIYNCLVERRQKVVMDRAVKSSAVVQSLFPETVQQRLYEEAENTLNEDNNNNTKSLRKTNNSTWKNPSHANQNNNNNNVDQFMTGEGSTELTHTNTAGGSLSSTSGAPIADLFPEATVFFADLAGFTKWSSSRSPADVFGLLETIYSTFDRLAIRRGVFKVEVSCAVLLFSLFREIDKLNTTRTHIFFRLLSSVSCLYTSSLDYRRLLRCRYWCPACSIRTRCYHGQVRV
jgi:Adenylate and Guanylate cyclase catalytic domain